MFILTPSPTFKATVKVNVATASGGWREESFIGVFKRLTVEEVKELEEKKFTEVVRQVLTGWDMVDENRQPVEFNEQNLEGLLQLPGAVRETALAFFAHNGGAKQKN